MIMLRFLLLIVTTSSSVVLSNSINDGKRSLLPEVHWETDTADYAHLIPSSHVSVFYSDSETDENGHQQVAHLWAEYFTDVVALEHSVYVDTIHCGERDVNGVADMTISFNDRNAYELARKEWSSYSELLFIGVNFTHSVCFSDAHEDSNRFWVMSQIEFQEEESDPQNHVTFKSLPIRFQHAIRDVDIKFGKQQKPLPNGRLYKRHHPLSPTNQKGPSLLPREEETETPTIVTGDVTLSEDILTEGLDPQLEGVSADFVGEDIAAFDANGFGSMPGADKDPSLLAADIIDPSATAESWTATDVIPTDTGAVDSGAPTPSATSEPFTAFDGPVTLTSYNATDPFVIVALANGNLVRRDETASLGAGETKTFVSEGGLVVSDNGERLFTLYQDEIRSFGVSRIRLHKQEMMPKTSLFATWVPIQIEGLTHGILAVSTTKNVYYAAVACDIQGEEPKIFVVPFESIDTINKGIDFLKSSASTHVVTGGIVNSCSTLMITNGHGGLPA